MHKLLTKQLIIVASFIMLGGISMANANIQAQQQEQKIQQIGIAQIVEHPALNAVRSGIIDELKKNGYEDHKNLKINYENAQGNIVTATQVATKLLQEDLMLTIGISTPSAQTLFHEAKKLGKKVPIVFTAVSDPKIAKLDVDPSYPITGITDTANLDGLLELIQAVLPNVKTLGLMYSPSEANSVSTITRLKKILKIANIKFVEATVNNTQDVAQATKSFLNKVDALYFPQDNTIVSAIQTVVNVATKTSTFPPVILPIFTNDPILIQHGILAAIGYDYYEVGKETGKVVAKILQGEAAKNIPVHSPEKLKAVINAEYAKKLGLTIPKKLKFAEIQVM